MLAHELAVAAAAIPSVLAACEVLLAPEPAGEVGRRTTTWPLVIPDDTAALVVDAGTGEVVPLWNGTEEYAGQTVPWWPVAPTGVRLPDTSLAWRDQYAPLTTGGGQGRDLALVGFAETITAIRLYRADYRALAASLTHAQGARDSRRSARDHVSRYTAWLRLLEPLGDLLAAQYANSIQKLRHALYPLAASEGTRTMPALVSTPAVIANIAQRIRDQITQGGGGRLQVSDSEQAFSWSAGLPVTMLNYLATGVADGRHIDTVTAKDSGAANGSVAEGGAKPDGVVFDTAAIDLLKFADTATITTESAQFVSSIEQAVTAVLVGRILRGIESATVATMVANAGVTITAATDITAGVLEAVAALAQNGSTATVVGLSATDWVDIFSLTGGNGYVNFSSVEAGPRGTWLGLAPCLVPSLTAGNAIVADGQAAAVFEIPGGPLVLVDPYSQAKNNKITIALETWAAGNVNSPGGVATVAVTAGGAASHSSRSKT
jgi:hypothetical protein